MSHTDYHQVVPEKEWLVPQFALVNKLTVTKLGTHRPMAALENLLSMFKMCFQIP